MSDPLEELAKVNRTQVRRVQPIEYGLPGPAPTKQYSPFVWGFGITLGVIVAFCLVANFFGFIGGFIQGFNQARNPPPPAISVTASPTDDERVKLALARNTRERLTATAANTRTMHIDWDKKEIQMDARLWERLSLDAKTELIESFQSYYDNLGADRWSRVVILDLSRVPLGEMTSTSPPSIHR